MKKIFFYIIIIIFTACGSIPNKPITRILTEDELQKAILKDSTFETTYEIIQARTIYGTFTGPNTNKYHRLTYKRIHKFLRFANDSAYFKTLLSNAEKRWNKKYLHYYLQVDSISQTWKKYINDNAPKNFVTIEAVDMDKEYYPYTNKVKKVFLKFRMVPTKKPISDLDFGYIFQKKNADSNGQFTKYDTSWCHKNGIIASSFIGSCTVTNPTQEQILKEKSSFEDFINEYEIIYFVDKLNADNKEINLQKLRKNVPPEIRGYWAHENKPSRDTYVKYIVENILNKPYITKEEYLWDIKKNELKKKDGIVLSFLMF